MDVREATAEVEPKSGAVVQVFTSGTMVQVFLLSGNVPSAPQRSKQNSGTQASFCLKPGGRSLPLRFGPLQWRINMQSQLTGTHQKTYQHLFQHPMPHNLQWREVWSMLGEMPTPSRRGRQWKSESHAQRSDAIAASSARQRPGRQEGIDAGPSFPGAVRRYAPPPPAAAGTHLLVVIDHREARIYRTELHGTVPQRIAPYDPFGFGRDLHYNQDDSNGRRKPERKSFYEAVAKTLQRRQQI